MPVRYQVIEHTADIGIRVAASSLNEAFENAAYAMFDITCDISSVRPLRAVNVECQADDLGQLLVDWLSELLFLSEVKGMLFSDFRVKISGKNLKATVKGEPMDPARHGLKTDIKAVTYHMLEVDPASSTVQVLFDI